MRNSASVPLPVGETGVCKRKGVFAGTRLHGAGALAQAEEAGWKAPCSALRGRPLSPVRGQAASAAKTLLREGSSPVWAGTLPMGGPGRPAWPSRARSPLAGTRPSSQSSLVLCLFSCIVSQVHPPPFYRRHHLSDWPNCSLELHCCQGITICAVKLLMREQGDITFDAALTRLRCKRCGGRPAPVYLCAGHRQYCGGAAADWAIELVPKP